MTCRPASKADLDLRIIKGPSLRRLRLSLPSAIEACVPGGLAPAMGGVVEKLARYHLQMKHTRKPSTRLHMPRRKFQRSLVGEALVVAVATGFAYAFGFVYEMGVCSYSGIPLYLISVSPQFIFLAAIPIIAIITYAVVYLDALDRLLDRVNLLGLKGPVAIAIVSAIIYGYTLGFEPGYWSLYAAVALAVLAGLWVRRFSFEAACPLRKNSSTFSAHLLKNLARDLSWASRFFGELPLSIAVSVLAFSVLVYSAGQGSARRGTNLLAMKSDPTMALIRSYGDLMIFVRLDVARQKYGDYLLLRKIPVDTAGMELIRLPAMLLNEAGSRAEHYGQVPFFETTWEWAVKYGSMVKIFIRGLARPGG